MYISYAPIINFKYIVAAFYKKKNQNCWTSGNNIESSLYSRGKFIIEHVVDSVTKNGEGVVFIPAYYCELSLQPLRNKNHRLVFYHLDNLLNPDIDHINLLYKKHGKPNLLIVTHFFGVPISSNSVMRWANENGVMILEDAAHSCVPVHGIGDSGFPVMYTPWKFLPSRQGAVLSTNNEIKKNNFIMASRKDYSWFIKQFLLYFFLKIFSLPLHKIKKTYIKESGEREEIVNDSDDVISKVSNVFFSQPCSYYKDLAAKRDSNYRLLHKMFFDKNMNDILLFKKIPAKFAPYCFPLMVGEHVAYRLMTSLADHGVIAQPWGELSPEVKENQEFLLENSFRKGIVTLPIHQDLTSDKIKMMAKVFIELYDCIKMENCVKV